MSIKRSSGLFFVGLVLSLFTACGGGFGGVGEDNISAPTGGSTLGDVEFGNTKHKIPTLVIVMNWNNYKESDATVWYDKIFNKASNSVNRWYYDSTDADIEFTPVTESSGIANDGVIIVDMGKNHPGGSNDTRFRDTELKSAITSSRVVSSVDFTSLDLDGNSYLNAKELQVIFIVAGGEESYGDSQDRSIWAHAWSFDSGNGPSVDGVKVMEESSDSNKSGSYAVFGATHGIDTAEAHKATIGIMAHELGHSLLNLGDYYDNGGGSGLGIYDIMSNGSWASKSNDSYPGETPTQLSAFNKIDAQIDANVTDLNATATKTLKCSSNQLIKLETKDTNEYFLLECRDTTRVDSDNSFNKADTHFTNNRLFGVVYHVDTNKTDNNEDGIQTQNNHYKVALIERNRTPLMTSVEGIEANLSDVYTEGYTIDTTQTKMYDTTQSGYTIVVEGADYTQRTMTFRVTK